ncbi:MAG: FAD-binding oxidoreductase [Deltaproteobacteria bacterium]|nr:FAD-binding oxidoreductase [Deltaproteobacteria bacterium]
MTPSVVPPSAPSVVLSAEGDAAERDATARDSTASGVEDSESEDSQAGANTPAQKSTLTVAGTKKLFSPERLEWVPGWGQAVGAAGYVFRPSTLEALQGVVDLAEEKDVPLTLRGAGCSYGDAAFGPEGVVVDLSRLKRILSWDPDTGVLEAEPGVTIRDIWRYTLGDGWWPAVVPGTMFPTLGGCLAMNVHGKNNWARGTVGDHCLDLDLMLPSGSVQTLSRQQSPELFHAAIGSFGQLGLMTRIRWQLKKVNSGLVEVEAVPAKNLVEMLTLLDEAKDRYEYCVGWIDAFKGGRGLGRGQLHFARYLQEGEDSDPQQTLRLEAQDLPETFLGIVPKSILWRLMKPTLNRLGMRLTNAAKYASAATLDRGSIYRQSLAGYQFLLDYVPGWKKAYLPGGLIQFQSFVPREAAEGVFRGQLELCRLRRMPSFLAVLKRHRADPFLLTHAVDGFSLALDFPVTSRNRPRLWALVREMAELAVAAGGRFYPAKDAAIPSDLYRQSFAGGELERFAEIKDRLDPHCRLTSALTQRLLPDGFLEKATS